MFEYFLKLQMSEQRKKTASLQTRIILKVLSKNTKLKKQRRLIIASKILAKANQGDLNVGKKKKKRKFRFKSKSKFKFKSKSKLKSKFKKGFRDPLKIKMRHKKIKKLKQLKIYRKIINRKLLRLPLRSFKIFRNFNHLSRRFKHAKHFNLKRKIFFSQHKLLKKKKKKGKRVLNLDMPKQLLGVKRKYRDYINKKQRNKLFLKTNKIYTYTNGSGKELYNIFEKKKQFFMSALKKVKYVLFRKKPYNYKFRKIRMKRWEFRLNKRLLRSASQKVKNKKNNKKKNNKKGKNKFIRNVKNNNKPSIKLESTKKIFFRKMKKTTRNKIVLKKGLLIALSRIKMSVSRNRNPSIIKRMKMERNKRSKKKFGKNFKFKRRVLKSRFHKYFKQAGLLRRYK